MSWFDDVLDDSEQSELARLDALERRGRECEQQQAPATERPTLRMVGAQRGRLEGNSHGRW